MNEEFRCKSKSIANYFVVNGSRLLREEFENGEIVFIFKYDETIDANLASWQFMLNRCMF